MGRLLLASLLSLMCLPALADEVEGPHVQGETFEYATGGQTYQGYLAYNASDDEPRPGVLLVHEWWGLNDYIKHKADQLAALGFVVLAAAVVMDATVLWLHQSNSLASSC